uniref:Pentatricopeptide repeat-containing protein, mitochondrial n=1 Tax=Noccaea caerulescens TaxID=107243 RepID=A0A1J3FGZ5_NOCCA
MNGSLLAFKWGKKRGCDDQKACDFIIGVLGSDQKFNIAWCLIRDMFQVSRDIRKAMFLMIGNKSKNSANEFEGNSIHINTTMRLLSSELVFLQQYNNKA